MKYELTIPQESVFDTEQFYGIPSVSNIGGYILLPGRYSPAEIKESVQKVVLANDGLWARLSSEDAVPSLAFPVPETVDCPSIELDSIAHIDAYVTEQLQKPFAETEHLYDFRLLRVKDSTALMIKLHHLVADSWAVSLILNQLLTTLQHGENAGSASSYLSYIADDRKYRESVRFQKDSQYWKKVLQKRPNPISVYQTESDSSGIKAGRNSYQLDNDMSERIRTFCARLEISPSVFFEAVAALYAMRIHNADDMTMCVISANRASLEEKNTVGMLNNILPLFISCDWDMPFRAFCTAIAEEHYSLLRHSRFPLSGIRQIAREVYGNGVQLYDMMVSYQADSVQAETDLDARWLFSGFCELGFMLNIDDRLRTGGYHINIDYQGDKLDSSGVEAVWSRFLHIIEQVLADETVLFKDVEIVTAQEKKQILAYSENEGIAFPDTCIHTIFENIVRKYGGRTAVTCIGQSITYEELNQRANAFALKLREVGVGRETIVAVVLPKSINTIIATLAVLKAGGAYLPIDPDFPSDRIRFMLSDSGTRYLISFANFIDKTDFDGFVFDVEKDHGYVPTIHYNNLETYNKPGDLLYIIYTSGSTGTPKGAMIEHRNVVRLFFNESSLFDFNENDVWTMFHSYCFDFSVWEIYGALLFGGKLVIVPKEIARDTAAFVQLTEEQKVTVLSQTPAAFYHFIDEEETRPGKSLSVRMVIFGGEALKPSLLKGFHHRYPDVQLINMYGITETTVHVTYKKLDEGNIASDSSNVGTAIPTLSTYIMDKSMGLLPRGLRGEICVAGEGVCRGYLNRDKLTRERFVFHSVLNKRIYRSGDSAVMTGNGDLEYHGRIDNQVKIRGFRVELGEIEKKILSYPRIKDVVVIVRKRNDDDLLCAYLIPEAEIDLSLLRGYLHTLLPDYMLPVSYTVMESFPLTSNGKVDRKALPEPVAAVKTEDFVPPENETEKAFESILCTLLNVDQISVEGDLFEYGLSSFTVVKFITLAYSKGYGITTSDVYAQRTIRKLSNYLAGHNDSIRIEKDLVIETVPDFVETDRVTQRRTSCVLMTGATGFLGIHLLRCLLLQSGADVYCVVRGKSHSHAENRLFATIRAYFGEDFLLRYKERIHTFVGNICEENFGIHHELIARLTGKTDLLIHAAALVKYYGDEAEFEKINVAGTRYAMAFAEKIRARYAHISTVGISGSYLTHSDVKGASIDERSFYIGQNYRDNLYVRTKFEAENEVLKGWKRGCSGTILRMGNLLGRWEDGRFQTNIRENAFYNILRSVISIRCVPQSMMDVDVELTPVDLAAEASVRILLTEEAERRVFHIANPHEPKFGTISAFLNEMGLRVEAKEDDAFYRLIREMAEDEESNRKLSGLMIDMNSSNRIDYNIDVTTKTDITAEYLKKCGFIWPVPDYAYIERIIHYLDLQGLIDKRR
jgi:amino acid adenylation domain-containing protein/thioester reductase-like protein